MTGLNRVVGGGWAAGPIGSSVDMIRSRHDAQRPTSRLARFLAKLIPWRRTRFDPPVVRMVGGRTQHLLVRRAGGGGHFNLGKFVKAQRAAKATPGSAPKLAEGVGGKASQIGAPDPGRPAESTAAARTPTIQQLRAGLPKIVARADASRGLVLLGDGAKAGGSQHETDAAIREVRAALDAVKVAANGLRLDACIERALGAGQPDSTAGSEDAAELRRALDERIATVRSGRAANGSDVAMPEGFDFTDREHVAALDALLEKANVPKEARSDSIRTASGATLDALCAHPALGSAASELRDIQRVLAREMMMLELPGLSFAGRVAEETPDLGPHHLAQARKELADRRDGAAATLGDALARTLGPGWRAAARSGREGDTWGALHDRLKSGDGGPMGDDEAARVRSDLRALAEAASPGGKRGTGAKDRKAAAGNARLLQRAVQAVEDAGALSKRIAKLDGRIGQQFGQIEAAFRKKDAAQAALDAQLADFFRSTMPEYRDVERIDLHDAAARYSGKLSLTQDGGQDGGISPQMLQRVEVLAAVEDMRKLDEKGLLSPALVRRLADGAPQMRAWASDADPHKRADAAASFGSMVWLATEGRLPDDLLARFDRLDDVNKAVQRERAEANGEPAAIGDIRAELDVASRRLAHAMKTLGVGDNTAWHERKTPIFSGNGTGGVKIDPAFIKALRKKDPDAARDVGFLLANVAMLQRTVEPFNHLVVAKRHLAEAEADLTRLVSRGAEIDARLKDVDKDADPDTHAELVGERAKIDAVAGPGGTIHARLARLEGEVGRWSAVTDLRKAEMAEADAQDAIGDIEAEIADLAAKRAAATETAGKTGAGRLPAATKALDDLDRAIADKRTELEAKRTDLDRLTAAVNDRRKAASDTGMPGDFLDVQIAEVEQDIKDIGGDDGLLATIDEQLAALEAENAQLRKALGPDVPDDLVAPAGDDIDDTPDGADEDDHDEEAGDAPAELRRIKQNVAEIAELRNERRHALRRRDAMAERLDLLRSQGAAQGGSPTRARGDLEAHFGLDRKDLEMMGLDKADIRTVERRLKFHVETGMRSARDVKLTTDRINRTIRNVVRSSAAQNVMQGDATRTGIDLSNRYLDRIFAEVTGRGDPAADAGDAQVRIGFQARMKAHRDGLSPSQSLLATDALRNIQDDMTCMVAAGARLMDATAAVRDSAAEAAALADGLRTKLKIRTVDGVATIKENSAAKYAGRLAKALRLRAEIEDLHRQGAGRRVPDGRSDLGFRRLDQRLAAREMELKAVARDLAKVDLATLGKRFRSRPVDQVLAEIERMHDAVMADPQKRSPAEAADARLAALVARVEHAVKRGPREVADARAQIEELNASMEEARGTLRESMTPAYHDFVRDTIRAAVLAARPQTLDLKYKLLEDYDAASPKNRAKIDEILEGWGLDPEAFRPMIDEVVFNSRDLFEGARDRGGAQLDQTVGAMDIATWDRELSARIGSDDGKIRKEERTPTRRNAFLDGGLNFLSRHSFARRSSSKKQVQAMMRSIGRMPVQSKRKIVVGLNGQMRLGGGVDVGALDAGLRLGLGGESQSVLEIKRGAKEYEVRFRAGGGGAAGLSADAGILKAGFAGFGAKGGRAGSTGVVLHFGSAKDVQAFVGAVMTKGRVDVEDWSKATDWEFARQSKASGRASAFGGIGARFQGAQYVAKSGLDAGASYTYKSGRSEYENAGGHEVKRKHIHTFALSASANALSLGFNDDGVGKMEVGALEMDKPDIRQQKIAGLWASGGVSYSVMTRSKEAYGSDDILAGASYLVAMPVTSRDPDRLLDGVFVDRADRDQFRAVFDEDKKVGDETKPMREHVRDALSQCEANDNFVIEFKMDPKVQAEVQSKQETLATLRDTLPEYRRQGQKRLAEAAEREIRRLETEVAGALRDKSNFRPEAFLIGPMRSTSKTDVVFDALGMFTVSREASESLRYGLGYVPAPKGQDDLRHLSPEKRALETELASRLLQARQGQV